MLVPNYLFSVVAMDEEDFMRSEDEGMEEELVG